MRTNLELLQRQNKECEVCLIMRTPESECVIMTFESLDEMEDFLHNIYITDAERSFLMSLSDEVAYINCSQPGELSLYSEECYLGTVPIKSTMFTDLQKDPWEHKSIKELLAL